MRFLPSVALLSGVLLVLSVSDAHAVNLSPSQNGGSGNIPGTYSSVVFSLSDGDWVPTLRLAATAPDAATVTIQSSATFSSSLSTSNTDYPLSPLTISKGDRVTFTYHASSNQWKISAPTYSPNTVGAQIPALTGIKIARYTMTNGDWTESIVLPATAADKTIVLISSDATWSAQISPQNIFYPSTFDIQTGDSYSFMYRTELQRWAPLKTPIRSLGASQAGPVIARPTAPRTEVMFANGDWIPQITLPGTAGDRDRIKICSSAEWAATISNANVDFTGTLQLRAGYCYEFMFIKEKNRWVVQSSPTARFNVSQLSSGQVPDTSSPVTEVIAADGNWAPRVILPKVAKPGDRVIVRSTATYEFNVTAEAADFTWVRMSKDDQVRFLRTTDNRWTTETHIITMLLVYSDAAAALLGESAEKARLLEGLRLTNEALENSRVNFYVKAVGIIKRQLPGGTLEAVIDVGRRDLVIQTTRLLLGADAVYYEGTEAGCGLGWINASAYNMIAAGSLNCGTTVMRHEFGHNMGLVHADDSGGSAPYAKGYSAFGLNTIMGGNAIGFYSNPRIYSSELGIPLGIENQVDAVRALNERSEAVSKYY
jgi:metalloprotease StcE-like protein/reprolysin-like metallo-peptidase family M12B